MPPDNIYMGEWIPMYEGEEPPTYSTDIPPLEKLPYFTCKWSSDDNKWVYVEAPLEPGKTKHPLDEVLTYADCRKMDYPNYIDYIDGIVKGDEEQVAKYIQDCKDVKAKWIKTMEPITLREKLNLHINNNATQEENCKEASQAEI